MENDECEIERRGRKTLVNLALIGAVAVATMVFVVRGCLSVGDVINGYFPRFSPDEKTLQEQHRLAREDAYGDKTTITRPETQYQEKTTITEPAR